MKTSNFYRLYVDGYQMDVLICADNMSDAQILSSMYLEDEKPNNVEVVHVHEKDISLEDVKNCVFYH